MTVSDVEVNSAAPLLQTKHADNTASLYSDVLLGDWAAERVSAAGPGLGVLAPPEGNTIGYRPLRGR